MTTTDRVIIKVLGLLKIGLMKRNNVHLCDKVKKINTEPVIREL
jgi:hypothetical protein